MTPATPTHVTLHGTELLASIAPNVSMKIVHVAALHGPITAFLEYLPMALVRTFNRHPRMRAKMVGGEVATAQVHGLITLKTVVKDELLTIRECPSEDLGMEATTTSNTRGIVYTHTAWQDFVERECELPIDRVARFPFYVHVWHDPSQHRARVMVFSDHYMSDGTSGLAVLNDLIEFAATLARGDVITKEDLPFQPSLYDLWVAPRVAELQSEIESVSSDANAIPKPVFQHLIPLRADQKVITVPVVANSSSACFGDGAPDNMTAALRRCKQEGVTYFSALTAAIVTAHYYVTTTTSKKQDGHVDDPSESTELTEAPFKLSLDLDCNMRSRVTPPLPTDQVGAYFTVSDLGSFASKGVKMDSTRFWDLARQVKRDLDANLSSPMFPMPIFMIDKRIGSALTDPDPSKKTMRSIPSDVNISNIGKYKYSTTHDVITPGSSDATNDAELLTIESVHVYNSMPQRGPGTIMYVTSLERFHYAMMHKYEHQVGQDLFAAFVASAESIGQVEREATMLQVVQHLREALMTLE
uniref:Condensation domain-containing protein n=1 Tax=Globisporangium ultimum (strain ATCC 200006 / CBS 805.95 / DAOM BR144) TaxID=431595 RepID=K3X2R8_GLOUD